MPTIPGAQIPPPKSWDEFEDVCADVMMIEWRDKGVRRNGRQGQPQDGVDIIGRADSSIVGAQCKLKSVAPRTRLTIAEIKDEVQKARSYVQPLSKFYILTTDELDTATRNFVDAFSLGNQSTGSFEVVVWGWSEIRRRIDSAPSLVEKHYSFISIRSVMNSLAGISKQVQRLHTMAARPLSDNETAGTVTIQDVAEDLSKTIANKIVGIDFGTTGSRVACLIAGRPTILETGLGRGTMPSIVAFEKDDRVVVGEAARRIATDMPALAITAIKRLLGRKFDDEQIIRLKNSVPYSIVRSPEGDAFVEVNGRAYSPLEITTLLFKQYLFTAQKALEYPVNRAAITIPAYYNDHQRLTVKLAAEAAGWVVIRTIPEPTAASLFHGQRKMELGNTVVYDLGGGTFDVSILAIGDGVYEVLATDGDPFLGGEDFDYRIQDHFFKTSGVDRKSLSQASLRYVKDACERAKMELCELEETDIIVAHPSFLSGRRVSVPLSRATLEALIGDLVQRTLDICGRALAVAGHDEKLKQTCPLEVSEVDEVILVGGSTHLPLVEEAVEHYFRRKPFGGQRREDAVALGCAIQAGVFAGEVKDTLLLDVITQSIGIALSDGKRATILTQNTTIPAKKTMRFFSNGEEKQVSIHVFQGEGRTTGECSYVGSFEIAHSPGLPFGLYEITADVDANGVVKFSAKDVYTEETVEWSLQHDAVNPEPPTRPTTLNILDDLPSPSMKR